MNKTCLQAGVVGIGGYANAHHEVMRTLEEEGLLKVRSTCDPRADELLAQREEHRFEARGIRISPDFAGMFAEPLDLVSVSAPIHLHAMMHRACVEHGAACYLEKPPTLDPAELAAMIATDRQARKQTHVGFHLLHQPERLALKQRMVSGEFGSLRRAAFVGSWRRPQAYFQRNSWAGRLTLGGGLLLDSSFANAMAHYVNAVLFFAGADSLYAWASPVRAEAELYRANAIQGADTVFVRAELESGAVCHIATTHACECESDHREIYEFEHARVEIRVRRDADVIWADGRQEALPMPDASLEGNVRAYLAYLHGVTDRPNIRLEDCQAFVHLNALLYLAAPRIAPISGEHLRALALPNHDTQIMVAEGIDEAMVEFARSGAFPSDIGVPWGQKGGASDLRDLFRLGAAVAALSTAS